MNVKGIATAQHIVNSQNDQAEPMAATNVEKNNVIRNPIIQQVEATNDDAYDLTFDGNISPRTAHGSGPKPRQ